MITLKQVLGTIERHKNTLAINRKPGEPPSPEESRWAFLVTEKEIVSLVNEIQAENYIDGLTPEHAEPIKQGRAMLHLDGVPVLPELIIVGRLDG